MYQQKLRVSLVIPAFNEQEAIGKVVSGFFAIVDDFQQPFIDEIIVADNGSTDHTAAVAQAAGATIVTEHVRGYGHACMKAIRATNSADIIIFCDGDHAFYADQIRSILQPFSHGIDCVIGSRKLGKAEMKSLTFFQQWGNELAVFFIKKLWKYQYTDLGPFRAIRKACFDQLDMQELTYGWTVEMQIKVLQAGYAVCEVPVGTRVRVGQSKVSGTVKGSIGAGVGILSAIAILWWKDYKKAAIKKLTNA